MTTLEAVCYVLRRVGMVAVSALETGTNSVAGEVESLLDEKRQEILSEGWACNKRTKVVLSPDDADHVLIYAAVTISLANPTSIGQVGHGLATGDIVEFRDTTSTPALSGPYPITKTGADTYTVAVNVTAGGVGTVSNIIGGTVMKLCASDRSAWRNIIQKDDRLYDKDDNTDEFSGDVTVDLSLLCPLSKLPPTMQVLIAAETAVVYNDAHGLPARTATIRDNARMARIRARQADTQADHTNVLDSENVRAVLGHRYDAEQFYGGW